MRTDKQKQNNTSRLVLFDIDQTLITHGGATRKAMYKALQETLPIDLTRPEVTKLRMSGKTDPQIVREFILAGGIELDIKNESYWQNIINKSLELYLKFLPEEIDEVAKTPKYFLHDGVLEILQLLDQDRRIALGLLTGNVEKGARIKLERFNLNRFFPIGAYGSDSGNRSDLPAIAHKRAEDHYHLNLTPSQIIIIGDAENDVLCAKHYGAISLAVNTGTTTREELFALEPNYLFSSLKDTSGVLEAIMSESVPGGIVI